MIEKTVYVVVRRQVGAVYTESPEEQGLAEGPRLLRVFGSEQDALRYRDALLVYTGEALVVSRFFLEELWMIAKDVKIEYCTIPEAQWAVPVVTLWEPRVPLN